MERLTAERRNGIRTGYRSPARKEELVQRLGAYEDIGLSPEELQQELAKAPTWFSTADSLPVDDRKVLCQTVTAKGVKNYVLGYYAQNLDRWVTGMNSNVIRWTYLPEE